MLVLNVGYYLEFVEYIVEEIIYLCYCYRLLINLVGIYLELLSFLFIFFNIERYYICYYRNKLVINIIYLKFLKGIKKYLCSKIFSWYIIVMNVMG